LFRKVVAARPFAGAGTAKIEKREVALFIGQRPHRPRTVEIVEMGGKLEASERLAR
jgi:hypothetical protein